jgi:ATP-dependent DNA helicase RecG
VQASSEKAGESKSGSPAITDQPAQTSSSKNKSAPPDLQKRVSKPDERQARAENPLPLDREMSAGHVSLALLNADVTAVPGVGASMAGKLRGLGIRTIRDLLFYFPRQHRDYSKLTRIADIPFQEVTTTIGLIWEVETKRLNSGRTRTVASIGDETGRLNVSWFNQGYLQKQLNAAKGAYLVVTGVKQRFGNKVEFTVRSHELPERGDLLNTGRLVPIYPLTEGLHANTLRRYTKWTVDHYAYAVPDHLPSWLRMAGHLIPLPEAVSQIHYPENEQALESARRRLAFDELF